MKKKYILKYYSKYVQSLHGLSTKWNCNLYCAAIQAVRGVRP